MIAGKLYAASMMAAVCTLPWVGGLLLVRNDGARGDLWFGVVATWMVAGCAAGCVGALVGLARIVLLRQTVSGVDADR